MNYALFGQQLASISVAGRNPSWFEYEIGSPAERRAILERWSSLRGRWEACSDEDQASANNNYLRAVMAPDFVPEIKQYRPKIEAELETAQEQFLRGADVGPDTNEDQGL